MRCGHFQPQQAAQLSGNYVALLDESIQIGREKLLLLLGIKIEAGQSYCQPLCAEDVTVLGLEVQPSWTGQAVAAFLGRSYAQRQWAEQPRPTPVGSLCKSLPAKSGPRSRG